MSMFFAPVVLTRDIAPTLRSFDRRFERFINEHFFAAPAQAGARLSEEEKSWTVSLDLPGVTREDLKIQVEGPVVRIETRPEAPRAYKAAYELPQDIDVEATRAKLENGVLTLTPFKLQPVSRAREIRLD